MYSDSLPPYRVPLAIQRGIEQGKYAGDQKLPGNKYLELKALRPSQRAYAIKHKLISDPEHRTDLTGAITVVGTCMDMCPEFERHEREFQKDVDEWEKIPNTHPKRIDHSCAVKKYRRSAAGNDDPLPSDLRPPLVLKKTLDYLLHTLLPTHGLAATYAFIRDRTRAIRTDFVIQHVKDDVAIECFERIARFHILAVHAFCEPEERTGGNDEPISGFDFWLEVEQMMKTLQSLMQFYDDRSPSAPPSPNEAEFRSYYLIAHIRSTPILRRLQALPPHVFNAPILQAALECQSQAQALSLTLPSTSTHKSRTKTATSSLPLQNLFTRFFKRVENPGTSYLMACLLEFQFGSVRKSAIHALWKAYSIRHRGVPIREVGVLLGMGTNESDIDEEAVANVVRTFGMRVEADEDGAGRRVLLSRVSRFEFTAHMAQRHSARLVEGKRVGLTDVDIVDGRFDKAQETWSGTWQDTSVLEGQNRPSVLASGAGFSIAMSPFCGLGTTLPSHASTTPPWPSLQAQTSAAPTAAPTAAPAPIVQPPASPALVQPPSATPVGFSFPVSNAPPHPAATLFNASAFRTKLASTPASPSSVSFSSWQSQPSAVQAEAPVPASSVLPTVSPPVSQPLPQETDVQKQEKELKRVRKRNEEEQQRLKEQREKDEELHFQRQLLLRKQVEEEREREREQERERERERKRLKEEEEERKRRQAEEELESQRRRKLLVLLKQTADLRYISNIFGTWKEAVIRRGEKREQFRKSIKEMGLSGRGGDSTVRPQPSWKGKERAWSTEDVVSWEDMSQASVSESSVSRRRSRINRGRVDEEAMLAAMKEAEMTRLKLWESETFTNAVKRRGCVGDIWLCTASENGYVDEWLRTKFGASQAVTHFVESIQLSAGADHGPGLIVIDSSTLDRERGEKSDLARLRRCISQLPADRHYVPALLVLHWTESGTPHMTSELNRLKKNGIITSWHALTFVNDGTHFDDQFCESLKKISFDTVGMRVEKRKIGDLYKEFYAIWEISLTERLSSCRMEPDAVFDWSLYGHIISVMVGLLNHLVSEILRLCQINKTSNLLPLLDASTVTSEHAAFITVINYLTKDWLTSDPSALMLRSELTAALNNGRGFPVRAVPERIAQLMSNHLHDMVSPGAIFFLDAQSAPARTDGFSHIIHSSLSDLDRLVWTRSTSPKKRGACDDGTDLVTSNGLSQKSPKRLKHDTPASQPRPKANGVHVKPDALSKLKMTVAKARQSVDDLRSLRVSSERSDESVVDEGFRSWNMMSERGDSPQPVVGRASLRMSGYHRGEIPPTLFNPKEDILPLIPRNEFQLIPARSAEDLQPKVTSPIKAYTPAYPSFVNGKGLVNGVENSSSAWQIPSKSDTSYATRWSSLKGSVEQARKAVERSRRERESRTNGQMEID